MAGRRVNLADLAGDTPLSEARVPAVGEPLSQRAARLEQVAANPLNTRDVQGHPDKIAALAESIRQNGQLQPCTVVTRRAFTEIFPEFAETVGDVLYVQVTGARRRVAVAEAGLSQIDISVKDGVAASRSAFISATTAENIDREDYDPIEEALQVQLLVRESGSGQAAAQQLSRTPGWITQRVNLLRLEPELQSALRAREIPIRQVRQLHKASRPDQLAALASWNTVVRSRERADTARELQQERQGDEAADEGAGPVAGEKRRRRTGISAAIHTLGGTPMKIAQSLRAELSEDDRRTLAEALLSDQSL